MTTISMSGDTDELSLLQKLMATPEVFRAIAEAQGTELQIQSQLRKQFDADLVRGALAVVAAREKARDKFRLAAEMWLTTVGAEQATSEPVARYKAQRFTGEVFDLCCGIGGDAIALAERGPVVAVDRSPANCLRTETNVRLYVPDAAIRTRVADVVAIRHEFTGEIHLDPDRRTAQGKRTLRLEQGSPNLDEIRHLMEQAQGGAVKVSPAANFGGKFPDAETELISLHGECKEATIWFGSLAEPGLFRATSLPSGETISGYPLEAMADLRPPGAYLFDPDPAVVRAGLVNQLAEQHNLGRLDDQEEYLTGDTPPQSAFVRGFKILDVLPSNEKTLRKALRALNVGEVEIKARHIPIDVEATRRRLPLSGSSAVSVIYARFAGKSRIVIAERV